MIFVLLDFGTKTHNTDRKVPKSNKTKHITLLEKFQSPIKQNT
jgi:hypothetical protein